MPRRRRNRTTLLPASGLLALLLSAAPARPPLAQAPPPDAPARCVDTAPTAPPAAPATWRQAVVVNDSAVLRHPDVDFSLRRTLGAIVSSVEGMVDTPAERIALLAGLLRTLRAGEHVHPVNGLTLEVRPRPNEAGLAPAALLDPEDENGMRVVGLFNRLDLAPEDFSNCGEHRIVYAKGAPRGTFDRLTLIFEARVQNPRPGLGREGCRPIAEFWNRLPTLAGRDLAKALEGFYYQGDTNGDGTPELDPPVVSAMNYGVDGLGQVRGNLFVTNRQNPGDPSRAGEHPWQLREWRVALGVDGAPLFRVQPVGDNPVPALYAPHRQGEDPDLTALRRAFQDEFAELSVSRLTALDRAAGRPGAERLTLSALFARLGAGFDRRYNAFQSTSQPTLPGPAPFEDDPLAKAANTPFADRISDRLAEFVTPAGCRLTAEHALNRAGALSCGGCHQFSGNRPVAPGVAWPTTREVAPGFFDFVHIDEAHRLSPALETHFLPERHGFLQRFLGAPPPAAAAVAAAAAAAPPPAMASLRTEARRTAARVTGATDRGEALRALSDLEDQARAVRERERELPGAFVPFRRTH
jgi:hypothetical protein